MKVVSATRARDALYNLIDEVSETSEPVRIVGPRSAAVLISASDWRAIEETLHRLLPRDAAGAEGRDW
jgi:antitoxin YefM